MQGKGRPARAGGRSETRSSGLGPWAVVRGRPGPSVLSGTAGPASGRASFRAGVQLGSRVSAASDHTEETLEGAPGAGWHVGGARAVLRRTPRCRRAGQGAAGLPPAVASPVNPLSVTALLTRAPPMMA